MKTSLLLFVCVLGVYCKANSKDVDSVHFTASKRISTYIHDSLPSYHPIVSGKCDSSQLLIKLNMLETYCCFSDFDGDGINDYAFLLRNDSNRIFLVVFRVNGSSVSHVNIDNYDIWAEKLPELRIEVEPKGIWKAIDESIKVDHDGVLLTNENESLTFAYYFKNNQFHKFYYD